MTFVKLRIRRTPHTRVGSVTEPSAKQPSESAEPRLVCVLRSRQLASAYRAALGGRGHTRRERLLVEYLSANIIRSLARSGSTAEADAPPPGAAMISQVQLRSRRSLQRTAIGAVALLALYLSGIAIYAMHERAKQLHAVMAMESNHARHDALATVNYWLTHSIVTMQISLKSSALEPLLDETLHDFHDIAPTVAKATRGDPTLTPYSARFFNRGATLAKGRDRDSLIALRDAEQELVAQIEGLMKTAEMDGYTLAHEYRARNQRMATTLMGANMAGVFVFAAWLAMFFWRLTRDMKQLECWAMAVIEDWRHEPLYVEREDELGAVIRAVNRMQEELRLREQKEGLVREQRFHQEKMAAIGSMAAAVAHEVNNPIDAIAGIAQTTIAAINANELPDASTLRWQAELLLLQSERVGAIVRQLSELSTPHSQLPELLDLNALVETNCAFLQYDPRFRDVDFQVQPDRVIAPVRAVSDHLTQVLMNLLINAADACESLADRRPVIQVATRDLGGEVELSVCDNGHGMTPEVLAHTFEEGYTTKPADKGRGVGLFLCKMLIDRNGGRIALQSTVGVGTCARITLPAACADTAE